MSSGTQGTTRTYYIAADPVTWDYAPTGMNGITGAAFEGDAAFFATANWPPLQHVSP